MISYFMHRQTCKRVKIVFYCILLASKSVGSSALLLLGRPATGFLIAGDDARHVNQA